MQPSQKSKVEEINAYLKNFRTEKLRSGDLKTPGTHLNNSGYSPARGFLIFCLYLSDFMV